MRKFIYLFISICIVNISYAQKPTQKIIVSDIENFWKAYDKIIAIKDTLKQEEYLRELYINKASDGLKSMMEVRNYTEKEYLTWIIKYLKFFQQYKRA